MRKSIIVAAFSVLILGHQTSVYSASDNNTVNVSLSVNDLFGLDLVPATPINLGAVAVGTEHFPPAITCRAFTNHNMAWVVAMQANPLQTSGGAQIPAANFTYYHTYNNPDGTEIPAAGSGEAQVPSVETDIFQAGPNIYNANFTEFGIGLHIVVAANQPTGDYSTVLNLRMIDGF